MSTAALVQPLTIASQLVIQTNLNVQQAREALEQARESEAEQAVNNPNPERAPVEASDEADGGNANQQGAGQENPNRGKAANLTA